MGFQESPDHSGTLRGRQDHLHPDLGDPLQPTRCTDKRGAPFKRLEGAGTGHLKAAMAVAPFQACPRIPQCLQHLLLIALREIENKFQQLLMAGNLEHPPPLLCQTKTLC